MPVVEANGGGAVVNVLTLVALAPVGGMAGYSASKAAAHSMTQSLRAELRGRGIEVFGAYPGGIDTDMLAGVDAGRTTIFPDATSAGAGELWRRDPEGLAAMLAG